MSDTGDTGGHQGGAAAKGGKGKGKAGGAKAGGAKAGGAKAGAGAGPVVTRILARALWRLTTDQPEEATIEARNVAFEADRERMTKAARQLIRQLQAKNVTLAHTGPAKAKADPEA